MSLMNRLGNATNPHQTMVPKVLTVCSAGLLRSPTAANVLHKEYGYNTRAAGATEEFALIPVDEVLLTWADEIVCVEPRVYDALRTEQYLPILEEKRVIVLNIPDKFEWGNPELEELILKQYSDASIMEKAYV